MQTAIQVDIVRALHLAGPLPFASLVKQVGVQHTSARYAIAKLVQFGIVVFLEQQNKYALNAN